ncbi:MAG: PqqD family protein [Holosporaceae bacterium]|jgi:hypothetical protein|nr:PqqD family protein [Holosporaceae bacterium]
MDDIVSEILGTNIPKLLGFKFRRNGRIALVRPFSSGGRVIEINETAVRVLSLCDGNSNINAIAQTIAEQYNAEFKTVRNDVLKLIRSFEGAKIITTAL